ncbi:6-phospho-3-hexuloisomerase [Dongia deserti]|uniref:6-phospho-3-hexuloisomerase n=1 Tax=Dongia deserti TaxID=2268030 RepID=UPI000E6564AE|nr:6-phospho-3-hexuloisomerase [Dongia deserti]
MNSTIVDVAHSALDDAGRVIEKLDRVAFEALAQSIAQAKTIALHGLGREGLQMKGLAMRLFHLGLDAHVVGEMTTPPLGAGDLLICSAGPGDFATIAALMKIATDAGAKTAVVTAQPGSTLAQSADHVLHIPAQTMADDQGSKISVLPMGSLFELSQMLVFELLVLRLRDIKGETAASMRRRHTNLE